MIEENDGGESALPMLENWHDEDIIMKESMSSLKISGYEKRRTTPLPFASPATETIESFDDSAWSS